MNGANHVVEVIAAVAGDLLGQRQNAMAKRLLDAATTAQAMLQALQEAEAGLVFAGADVEPATEFVPSPTKALRVVRAAISKANGWRSMTDLPIQDLKTEATGNAAEELIVGGIEGSLDLKNGGKVTIIASQEVGWHGFRLTSPKGRITRFALSDEALSAMVKLRTLIDEKERELLSMGAA